MAEAILEQQRRCGPYTSTMQLGGAIRHVVRSSFPTSTKFGDAKLPMRALTSFVNQEMEQLTEALLGAAQRLCIGGRIVVITFEPSEEAIVQRFLRAHEDLPRRGPFSVNQPGCSLSDERLAQLYPLMRTSQPFALRRVSEPLRTSAAEIARNRRSRSAALQVLEKVCRVTFLKKLESCIPENISPDPAAYGHSYYPPKADLTAYGPLVPTSAPPLMPLAAA